MYSVYLRDYNSTPSERFVTRSSEKLYIYDQISSDESLAVVEPDLNLAASKAGEFTCTIPRTNNGFNKIIKGVTRLFVTKNEKIIFMGRINEVKEDLWLNQVIMAEGALAYLNDSLSEKKIYSNENNNQTLEFLLTDILNHHNSKFPDEPWKQFNVVVCEAKFVGRDNKDVNSNYLSYYSINFDKTLELVTELVELADGAFKIEFNETLGTWDMYIYNKYNFPLNDSQPIEFGVNLLDLTKTNSFNDICTVVAPFGGDLIQTSKEIGDVVAGYTGEHPEDIYNNILIRGENDYNYFVSDVSQDPDYMNSGYWAFTFDIAAYNNAHPNNPIKKLYVSWRAYRFVTRNNYVADNAWRIISRVDGAEQSLGFHELTDSAGFESEINEVIDLTDPKYYRATHIMMGGWGGLIKPIIRRDATIVEENDKLSIENCEEFIDVDGCTHYANSPYLISNNLVNQYGVIEKKIEYDIEDSLVPITNWTLPYQGVHGNMTRQDSTALGYDVGNIGDEPDLNVNKGDYKIIPFDGAYSCIEYELPDLDSPNRPRGVFITSRMHEYGIYEWNGKQWRINGICVFLDISQQILSYQAAAEPNKGVGFTNLKREYIDLSDPKYYGTKYIRIGGYVGDSYGLELVPSDDKIAQDRLMAQAKLYLTSYQWEKVVIEATAVDLSMTDDQWESLEICSNVPVISGIPGGMYFPLTTLSIRLDSFEDNKIVLGYDNEDYISNQLSENTKHANIAKAIEERRTKQ